MTLNLLSNLSLEDLQLALKDKTQIQICFEYGITRGQLLRLISKTGIDLKPVYHQLDDEERRTIMQLYKEDISKYEIAKRLNRALATIQGCIARNGEPPPKRGCGRQNTQIWTQDWELEGSRFKLYGERKYDEIDKSRIAWEFGGLKPLDGDRLVRRMREVEGTIGCSAYLCSEA